MNGYRQNYGVPEVVEDPTLSAADALHVNCVNAGPKLTPYCRLGSRADSSDRRNDDLNHVASPKTSVEVFQPKILRGLVFSLVSMTARPAASWTRKSVPLGRY